MAADITDWTRVEEAKYEGVLLAKEVERIQKEVEENMSRPNSMAATKGGKGGKGGDRSKSPKKGGSELHKSDSFSLAGLKKDIGLLKFNVNNIRVLFTNIKPD